MFISEKNKKTLLKILIAYICITAFIALFGIIYEQFSHNVYSFWMSFAWLWVLLFGLIPHVAFYFLPINKIPGLLAGCFYNLGVAVFTAGSIYKGVVDIYGTTRDEMFRAYIIIAIICLVAGLALYGMGFGLKKSGNQEELN